MQTSFKNQKDLIFIQTAEFRPNLKSVVNFYTMRPPKNVKNIYPSFGKTQKFECHFRNFPRCGSETKKNKPIFEFETCLGPKSKSQVKLWAWYELKKLLKTDGLIAQIHEIQNGRHVQGGYYMVFLIFQPFALIWEHVLFQ